MRIVLDIETNSLSVERVKHIWCIVSKDIDTNEVRIFRNVEEDYKDFLDYVHDVTLWIGHNLLGYDLLVLSKILGIVVDVNKCIDTLVISKLSEYSRLGGHSLEAYGKELGLEKIDFNDFTQWSQQLEDYCVRDVEINHKLYSHFLPIITDPTWRIPIDTEQQFQYLVVNSLHNNGFAFDSLRARQILDQVVSQLDYLDREIEYAFPPQQVVSKVFTPKATKFGTINRTSIPRSEWPNIHNYKVGETYKLYSTKTFNPSSHKQLIEVLDAAGWKPEVKTKTHIDTLREFNKLKHTKKDLREVDIAILSDKLKILEKFGWRVNEENLSTLPASAPAPARILARRILLESRRRTLVEWLGLVQNDDRIHGKFIGIGAWTHRMAHQEPNTANIPNALKENGEPKLLGKELRSLWIAGPQRLLLGVDAESIQFRIFAHYVNSKELTNAIVNGTKSTKTDPHSYNQRILGSVCRTRQAAKRFIYALLLGAGLTKLSEVLECSDREAQEALDRILREYPGFEELKRRVIPQDAKNGYFIGLDGRKVPLPGTSIGEKKHLCMSGYLQNGEAIIMKKACLLFHEQMEEIKDWKLVNFVHDEWQTEIPDDLDLAKRIGQIQSECLTVVGQQLNLNCPLSGSFYNEDHKQFTIGTNWFQTH